MHQCRFALAVTFRWKHCCNSLNGQGNMQMFQTFRNACIALVQKGAIAEVRSAVKLFLYISPSWLRTYAHSSASSARDSGGGVRKPKRWGWPRTVLIELDHSLLTLSSNSYIWVMPVVLSLAVYQAENLADAWTEFKSNNDIAGLQNRCFSSITLTCSSRSFDLAWYALCSGFECTTNLLLMRCAFESVF